MKKTTSATKILCRHLLKQREDRISLLEQFVTAWDKYTDSDPFPHRIICGIINHLACTCGADELRAAREKIGDIE